MLKKIKIKRFLRSLKFKKKELKRTLKNQCFEKSKSFLIFYNCSNIENHNAFLRILSSLQLQNKSVACVGFYEQQDLPSYCIGSLNMVFIGKKNIEKLEKTEKETLISLLKKEFDVLIDLTQNIHEVLYWLSYISAAHLKIGISNSIQKPVFDISMDIDQSISIEELFQLAVNYQNMFQNKSI